MLDKPFFCLAMRKTILLLVITALFAACKSKDEGYIKYSVEYDLPDTLRHYAQYLPKDAIVYFKGDSTVSIQKLNDESTTVITNQKAGFMQVLLKSPTKKIIVNYTKADQDEEKRQMPKFNYKPQKDVRTIAGVKATKYLLEEKLSGETSADWFSKDVKIIPNSLTLMFDPSVGFPMDFTLNQNGIRVRTVVKEIKYQKIPAGVFTTPFGYTPLTPQQLKELPVE
jgi:hypothetical protein